MFKKAACSNILDADILSCQQSIVSYGLQETDFEMTEINEDGNNQIYEPSSKIQIKYKPTNIKCEYDDLSDWVSIFQRQLKENFFQSKN